MRRETSSEAAEQVIGVIEPLLKEADSAAKEFESQLSEKKQLISNLNERLDSRIISLNLLLNRAQTGLSNKPESGSAGQEHVYDQQESILELYNKGHKAEAIAEKLSMPKGEVDLVLDMKKKFSKITSS